MKFFFAFLILATTAAQAQVLSRSFPLCSSWNYSNGYYVCSGFPMSQSIPDAYSLNEKVRTLEARIQALEQKLILLEQQTQEKKSE